MIRLAFTIFDIRRQNKGEGTGKREIVLEGTGGFRENNA